MPSIVLDPVPRVDGRLRLDLTVEGGRVAAVRPSRPPWAGAPSALVGQDPRDAWLAAQRICRGTCGPGHALAAVRAVEDALDLAVPCSARHLRNLMSGAHGVAAALRHFYQGAVPDWFDLDLALHADASVAARRHGEPAARLLDVQDRLRRRRARARRHGLVSPYSGHPGLLPDPERALVLVSHGIAARQARRAATRVVALLGGQAPRVDTLAVGGVVQGVARRDLDAVRELLDQLRAFVHEVYLPDALALATLAPGEPGRGGGAEGYLAVPEFPHRGPAPGFDLSGGASSVDGEGAETFVRWEGERLRDGLAHAPRFHGRVVEVGAVAQVLAGLAAGDPAVCRWAEVAGRETAVSPEALASARGRHVARAIRAAALADLALEHWHRADRGLASGEGPAFVPPTLPSGRRRGVGFHEGPRGVVAHRVDLDDGVVVDYHIVSPSAWTLGLLAGAVNGAEVLDPDRPLEILRAVRSFDPCAAC